ncbi:ROK family protein [Arthrobacter tumbae]|uniref:ROK family protein n=1 Tax=Arthrobacter tumbae TaxID=163874 RepID=UPI00195A396D|nr:ROK family protein [Arthrobacter tumbae]MBM7781897.1 putative NBD/HSP70 family sugar kinase [Arthrobacter tumbae]
MNSVARFGVGMQLGPQGLLWTATNMRGGILGRKRTPETPPHDPKLMVARVAHEYKAFLAALRLPDSASAGLALVGPGPIDQTDGSFKSTQTPETWSRFDMAKPLIAELEIPVRVENDANSAALGEFWSRQISRARTFACIYMNLGIGAGVVVDGALYRGASSNATELGHISLDPTGVSCFCGNHGCVERYAAPDAILGQAHQNEELKEQLAAAAGTLDTMGQFDYLARLAVRGNDTAATLIDVSATRLTHAALTLTNLFDLDHIVLAGPGFAVAGATFVSRLRSQLVASAFARHSHTITVELSSNPRDSAAIGAAALMLQSSVSPHRGTSKP